MHWFWALLKMDPYLKQIQGNYQQTIKQQLQCAGVKGKLSELRILYGIGNEEGFLPQIAVIGLGNKPEDLRDSLEKAYVAV